MQVFHEWLSSTQESADSYRQQLAGLMQASLVQIKETKNDLGWLIWNDEATGSEIQTS
jgi:hypothetical protein